MRINLLFPLIVFLAAVLHAAPEGQMVRQRYQGEIGEIRVGLTIVRRSDSPATIKSGHYFYQKQLTDIPLTGSVSSSELVLKEPGGGVFKLRFTGNGSNGKDPLNFENSVGLKGTWSSGDGSWQYPVMLTGTDVQQIANGEPMYADVVGFQGDAAFEAVVQGWWRAVLTADKAAALHFTSFPVAVNLPNGKRERLRNGAALLARWDEIFTPAMMEALRKDLPHDMFVHAGAAMLGSGEAWFDGKGLTALNVVANAAKPAGH